MMATESTDCEMIEPRELVDVEFSIEVTDGAVIVTALIDSNEDDVSYVLAPAVARELGDRIYKAGCRRGGGSTPT